MCPCMGRMLNLPNTYSFKLLGDNKAQSENDPRKKLSKFWICAYGYSNRILVDQPRLGFGFINGLSKLLI